MTPDQLLGYKQQELDIYEEYADIISKQHVGLECMPGHLTILKRALYTLAESGHRDILIENIKIVKGGLRFYYEGGDELLYSKIKMLEQASFQVCNICGDVGEKSKEDFTTVRCLRHKDLSIPVLTNDQQQYIIDREIKMRRKFQKEPE